MELKRIEYTAQQRELSDINGARNTSIQLRKAIIALLEGDMDTEKSSVGFKEIPKPLYLSDPELRMPYYALAIENYWTDYSFLKLTVVFTSVKPSVSIGGKDALEARITVTQDKKTTNRSYSFNKETGLWSYGFKDIHLYASKEERDHVYNYLEASRGYRTTIHKALQETLASLTKSLEGRDTLSAIVSKYDLSEHLIKTSLQ